ncbi:MAG: ArsC family transcriptional regulator [Gemmatimonadetes bacterium]|nr:MAG: ArsC family transcriptional regulator [Gemmatimonadota bacterium]
MNIQIFGTKKCKATQKALRFFKERGIKPHFVDLNEQTIKKGELTNIRRSIPLAELIDTGGKEYQRLNLKYLVHDVEEQLLAHPLLFKTPIVRHGSHVTVGHQPEVWKSWL